MAASAPCRASADERRRVEFHVLGPLEVTSGGRLLSVGGARTRAVLAFLLMNANAMVSADRLADELWPGLAPGRAAANLQVRLSELRKALRSDGEEDRLATRAPGYVLRVAPGELDVLRFEQLAASGREALAAGAAATAVRLLDESLAVWRGPALADLGDLPFAAAEQARLEEERLGVLESRVDAQLMCGRHWEPIAELETLTTRHPLRERFWSQRLLALYRAGRQADALRAYRELRSPSSASSGSSPGPSCATSKRGSCARTQHSNTGPPGRPSPVHSRKLCTPRTGKSTLPTRCSETAKATSCSCRGR